MRKFKVGDKVEWTSQARGRSRKKKGKVVAIAPPAPVECWVMPYLRHYKPKGFSRGREMFDGALRKEETYLVEVQKGGKAMPILYAPRTTHLRLVSR